MILPTSISPHSNQSQSTTQISSEISPKILCLSMGWFPVSAGGLNRYVYGLSCELSQQNSQVEVCGLDMPNLRDSSEEHQLKLTNISTPNLSILKRFQQIRLVLSRDKLQLQDSINLHFALYSFPILFSLPKTQPITFTFHGPWALESAQEKANVGIVWAKRQLEKAVFRRCDRFIVLSQAFGEILNREYHVPWHKINIIPGGVNIEEFQPNYSKIEARQKMGWNPNRRILFTPRRLVHRMGLDRLLVAMVEVRQKVPDVWLGIAGKGPIAEHLQQQIQDLDLADHVELLGFVPDDLLSVAYQAADLTIVPSLSLEGFGLILVESLAAGTPALSTPVGGMPEILRPLDEALVTDSTESSAIAARLIEFLQGDRCLPTRETCRQYAVQNFDWRIIAPQVKKILLMPK